MKRLINILIEIIFPMICNRKCEKVLDAKKNKLEGMDSEDIYSYDLEYIKFDKNSLKDTVNEEYKESISRLKQFEDKAKTNLIAITISVTMILGLIKSLNEIYIKCNNIYINSISFIISILAVVYMLYSGNSSLKVLMEKNIIYKVGINELEEKNEESLKKIYGMYGELNEINNTIRNNYINTSYKCIRNALILLSLIFVIGAIPFNNTNEKEKENELQKQINAINTDLENIKEENIKVKERIENQNKIIKDLEIKIIMQKQLWNNSQK